MAYINGKEILFSPKVEIEGINAKVFNSLISRTITEFDIPEGVTTVGANICNGCNLLKTVTFPDGVKIIGANAFAYCSLITGVVTLPNTLTTLSGQAFRQCNKVTKFEVGNSLKTIGERAFESCSALTEITLPNTVTSIASNAFNSCSKLAKIICDFTDGEVSGAPWGATNAEIVYLRKASTEGLQYTLINEGTAYAVTGYTGTATDVYVGSRYNGKPVTEIGNNAFDPQNGVNFGGATKVEIAEGITKIGDYAFAINALETVILPSTLESIGAYAFDSCGSLRNIEIPDSVTNVGDYAFTSCGLYYATLGYGCLWRMGNEVFAGCNSLLSIYVPWSDGNNDGAPWGATNVEIHYDNA